MIYFTSDVHFGHEDIVKLYGRPFPSVEDMDETIIQNWNSRVCETDEVYILGDLMFRAEKPAHEYLERLNGKKHLIVGNHDNDWLGQSGVARYFESVSTLTSISDGERRLVLCHYPMMTWDGKYRGAYHIYGHIHENKRGEYWPLLETMKDSLNAGMDVNNFRPVTFDELVENNRVWKGEQM